MDYQELGGSDATYMPMDGGQNQGISFNDFLDTLGNSVDQVISGFGTTTDANAINALAIANLNKAKADAVKSNAENQKQITKSIFIVLIVAILVVGAVAVIGKFWSK
jgi:hypothetical protein